MLKSFRLQLTFYGNNSTAMIPVPVFISGPIHPQAVIPLVVTYTRQLV